MRRSALLAAAALAAGVALAGCATQVSPDDPVYQKLDALQKQVGHLQQVAGGQGVMNMASEQQQLEQEIATLQGQVQDLQHELQQSENRQQLVAKDFDQRLSALEQGASAVGISTGGVRGAGAQTAAPGATSVPAPASAATQASTGGGQSSDYQAYEAAFAKLKNSDYTAAVTAFNNFIKTYPDSPLVANAWYWTGQIHSVNGEYQEAIQDFQQVLTKYSDSPKAPDAYLKIGYAQYAMKDYKNARQTFKAVISRYPGTTAADLAGRQLQQMDTQGQ